MREIGGYLAWEPREGVDYYPGLYRFDAIRSALHFIIKKKHYRKVWIPNYLCSCIRDTLEHIGIAYQHYSIQKNFLPSEDVCLQESECLFFVNYFGQFANNDLLELIKRYPNIFIDNTHSFFQPPIRGVDTGYTCRKYFGVPDGAYLSTEIEDAEYEQLPFDSSYLRMGYIMGRYETDSNTCYKEFVQNDMMFRGAPIKKMSRLVHNILCGLDYRAIIEKRQNNFLYLHRVLKSRNELSVKNYAGLFLYPFLHENGLEIKKNLIAKKIYVPTLWPEILQTCSKNSWEYRLASDLVLLPIDHRYAAEDMQYMLNILFDYL